MNSQQKQFQVISLSDVPNGAEQVLLKMALAINAKLIFLKKNNGPRLSISSHVAITYLSQTNIFFGLLKLIPLLRKFKKDEVIISSHPYLNAYLGFFKRIGWLKPQLIARECTSVFTRFKGFKRLIYRVIYRMGYPAIDLMVCQTELMKEQLIKYNPFINEQKVLVQPNPVDFEKLVKDAEQPLLNERHDISFICAAGRLIPEKGFDVLIKSFSIVHKKYPWLKLFILGEGKEKQHLMALVKQNKLQDSIVFKGHIANPAPYFKYAKLCVISSITEGFPNVLLEMLALNKAVVSTLCAGGISAIPYIQTAKVNDVEELALAIEKTLQQTDQSGYRNCIVYLKQRNPEKFAQSILSALA
ncbi:glycosyltransferase [Pedobacter sp. B4-66]|uniref:glycosyltransferase n=1 Tax=Pedobacter sp. B4-66 TaxID=2817280 RepID=UPI001BDB6B76|nr:glycosyltransferase [Pedobacter sp. B4-66]